MFISLFCCSFKCSHTKILSRTDRGLLKLPPKHWKSIIQYTMCAGDEEQLKCVCVCVCVSVSLSHTHTHTHTDSTYTHCALFSLVNLSCRFLHPFSIVLLSASISVCHPLTFLTHLDTHTHTHTHTHTRLMSASLVSKPADKHRRQHTHTCIYTKLWGAHTRCYCRMCCWTVIKPPVWFSHTHTHTHTHLMLKIFHINFTNTQT